MVVSAIPFVDYLKLTERPFPEILEAIPGTDMTVINQKRIENNFINSKNNFTPDPYFLNSERSQNKLYSFPLSL